MYVISTGRNSGDMNIASVLWTANVNNFFDAKVHESLLTEALVTGILALFSLSIRSIFKTSIINRMKTKAITTPAMLLSMEPSAFQNQTAKRTSITKSITAKSAYGLEIFAGLIFVLLKVIFDNLVFTSI